MKARRHEATDHTLLWDFKLIFHYCHSLRQEELQVIWKTQKTSHLLQMHPVVVMSLELCRIAHISDQSVLPTEASALGVLSVLPERSSGAAVCSLYDTLSSGS